MKRYFRPLFRIVTVIICLTGSAWCQTNDGAELPTALKFTEIFVPPAPHFEHPPRGSGSLYLGLAGGVAFSRFRTPPTPLECDCAFGSSLKPGPLFGVVLEQGIARRTWLVSRVQYTDRSGSFDAGRDETMVLSGSRGSSVHTAHSTVELEYAMLDIGVGVKFMPLRLSRALNGGVVLGPSFGFVTKGRRSWYRHLTPSLATDRFETPGIVVRDGGATLVMEENLPTENMKGWRTSIRVGTALDLEWARDGLISPSIIYDIGLTPVIHEGETVNTLMLGLDVAWRM